MAAYSVVLPKAPRGTGIVKTGTGHRERQESNYTACPLSIHLHWNYVSGVKRKSLIPRCRSRVSHNAPPPAYQVAKPRGQPPHLNQGDNFASTSRVPIEVQLQYERKGHVCLRQLLPAHEMDEVLEALRAEARKQELDAYRQRLTVLCPRVDPLSCTSVQEAQRLLLEEGKEEVGFLQFFNLHRTNHIIRHLCASPRLAGAAADLLGCKKVRLYSDCLFVKHPGFGCTHFHSDLNMVPLDTNAFATFWIPLHTLEEGDSRLLFASGSHRDFALPYWQSVEGMGDLMSRGYSLESHPDLKLGDVTVHAGWTLHWAPEQPEDRPTRMALAVSYFADGARVLRTKLARKTVDNEDAWSYKAWRSRLKEGQVARDAMLPLVYPPPAETK